MSSTVSSRWRYRAAAADGASVRGEIEAASERDAIDALRQRALWVVDLEPLGAAARRGAGDRGAAPRRAGPRFSGWAGAGDAGMAVVVRSIATLLSAGVPLHRALSYASQEAPNEPQRAVFTALRSAIERGESLSAAVAAHDMFPPVFAPLIAAGESSGTLDGSLALLADHLERRDALHAKLRAALVYPTILGIASMIGVVVILLVVVPRFATLINDSGGTLPLSTRALIAVSGALANGWWIVLLAIGIAALLVQQSLASPTRRQQWHAWRLRWPVLGPLERMHAAAGYTGTLAVALRAGVSLLGAMALARAVVRNGTLAASLAVAEERVRGGTALSAAVSGLLPPLTERLLDAGETSGDLAGMAARAADAADAELQRTIAQAVTFIEPVMILVFGGIVGFVALALLQAIYGINAATL